MEISVNNYVKGIIEAILFTSDKPVLLKQLEGILEGVGVTDIKKIIEDLQDEHHQRQSGMMIVEIAEGYQMLSNSKYATGIRQFYKKSKKEKLSKPSLETLAIVAYKQPVTRGDIELIRGVNSDGIVAHLLEKGLIKISGRKDVPGRPFLHETSQQFLEYFGLKSLADLPKLDDFPSLQDRLNEQDVDAEGDEEGIREDGETSEKQEVLGDQEVAQGQEASEEQEIFEEQNPSQEEGLGQQEEPISQEENEGTHNESDELAQKN